MTGQRDKARPVGGVALVTKLRRHWEGTGRPISCPWSHALDPGSRGPAKQRGALPFTLCAPRQGSCFVVSQRTAAQTPERPRLLVIVPDMVVWDVIVPV